MLIHLLRLQGMSIFKQLQLEEALLRVDSRNWCLINHGAPSAIVMGISGKVADLVAVEPSACPIPIIRRFSGGGCVVVDGSTSFVTMICNVGNETPPAFPQEVARWNADYYQPFLGSLDFRLLENDYVLGERKFGGNAQYLTKDRWLHHSTLLWDYHPDLMKLLKIPAKRPQYRADREHEHFLCRLAEHFPSQEEVHDHFLHSLKQKHDVVEVCREEVSRVLHTPHRQSTVLID